MTERSTLPGVTHLAIDVADLAASKRSYADVLGLDVRDRRGNAYVEWPGFCAAAPAASDPFHFGFQVASDAEVTASAELFRTRGATDYPRTHDFSIIVHCASARSSYARTRLRPAPSSLIFSYTILSS